MPPGKKYANPTEHWPKDDIIDEPKELNGFGAEEDASDREEGDDMSKLDETDE